jgi:type VI secretion system protein ImpA
MLNLEGLLTPIETATPSGPDLAYSPEYAALERAATGKPERVVGSATLPAEPPDWPAVLERAQALLRTTKDLRLALALARALVENQGFAGFADGLSVVRMLVERFWDTLHPQLDVDDNLDATARVSAMSALTHRDLIQALRTAPLIQSRAFGTVNLKALEHARSSQASPDKKGPAPVAAEIEAAFLEVPLDALKSAAAALRRCHDEAGLLVAAWSALLPGSGPDFAPLQKVLAQAVEAVHTRLDQRQGQVVPAAAANLGAVANGTLDEASRRAHGPGVVASSEDVLRALDAICAYYAQHEPSSPVPLMLQRAKRLVSMSFVDILKEMLPESIQNLQKITGKTDGGPS